MKQVRNQVTNNLIPDNNPALHTWYLLHLIPPWCLCSCACYMARSSLSRREITADLFCGFYSMCIVRLSRFPSCPHEHKHTGVYVLHHGWMIAYCNKSPNSEVCRGIIVILHGAHIKEFNRGTRKVLNQIPMTVDH